MRFFTAIFIFASVTAHAVIFGFGGGGSSVVNASHADSLDNGGGTNVLLAGTFSGNFGAGNVVTNHQTTALFGNGTTEIDINSEDANANGVYLQTAFYAQSGFNRWDGQNCYIWSQPGGDAYIRTLDGSTTLFTISFLNSSQFPTNWTAYGSEPFTATGSYGVQTAISSNTISAATVNATSVNANYFTGAFSGDGSGLTGVGGGGGGVTYAIRGDTFNAVTRIFVEVAASDGK